MESRLESQPVLGGSRFRRHVACGEMRARMRVSWLLVIAATLTGCGSQTGVIPAPPSSYLPVAPGSHVSASVVATEIVFHDEQRFRQMDLVSSRLDRLGLLRAEIRTLREHGWTHLRITACGGRGECFPIPASITNSRASAQLHSPDGSEEVSLSVLSQNPAVVYGGFLDPGGRFPDPRRSNRDLLDAFHRREAILDVSITTSRTPRL